MPKLWRIIHLLFFFGCAESAHAITAGKLHEWASANDRFVRAGMKAGSGVSEEDVEMAHLYIGYVNGAADAFGASKIICMPPAANNGEIGAVVSKYLDGNPVEWHYRAEGVISKALRAAYPCAD